MCNATAAEMDTFRAGNAGTLRIGVVSSVQGTLFMEWIARFSAEHPKIRYELYSANTYQLLEQLRMEQLDLAIVRTPFSAPETEILPLRKESMLAAGLASYLQDFSNSETISLADLAGKPLIVYRRWEGILLSRFEAAGCTPQIRCCNDDAQTTLAREKGTWSWNFTGFAVYQLENPDLTLLKIDDEALTTEIAVLCKSREQLPQVAQLFWEMMAE